VPELRTVLSASSKDVSWYEIINQSSDCAISDKSRLFPPYHLDRVTIGDYSYIDRNSLISMTRIGKFCSIGMNLACGRGIHPTNGISTSPYFYSDRKQNGTSISTFNKVEEKKWITIGNDVFIGMNVTILDGVQIGDGAVVGAGAVVSKDIPPYAVAVGCPIRIIGYRFDDQVIEEFLRIRWWEKDLDHFKLIESLFFDVDEYIAHMQADNSRSNNS
jgi:acetyltransferase-like isoleucine patch superfamily enzyme